VSHRASGIAGSGMQTVARIFIIRAQTTYCALLCFHRAYRHINAAAASASDQRRHGSSPRKSINMTVDERRQQAAEKISWRRLPFGAFNISVKTLSWRAMAAAARKCAAALL